MKRAVLTVSLILAGLNLLAWGLSGVEAAVDLQTGLAALCLNGYLFLFLLLGHAPFRKLSGTGLGGTAAGRWPLQPFFGFPTAFTPRPPIPCER